jgi:hypothetical protein
MRGQALTGATSNGPGPSAIFLMQASFGARSDCDFPATLVRAEEKRAGHLARHQLGHLLQRSAAAVEGKAQTPYIRVADYRIHGLYVLASSAK